MSPPARPCDKGPVPAICCMDLELAFRQYIEDTGSLNLHGYELKKASEGVDGCTLLKVKDLLGPMVEIQPTARYKPTLLQEVLTRLATDSALPPLNTSGLSDDMWSRCVSKAIGVMLYHYRRVKQSEGRLQECLKKMPSDQHDSLKEFLGYSVSSSRKKARVLKPQTSAASSAGSAEVPKLLASILEDEESEPDMASGSSGEEAFDGFDSMIAQRPKKVQKVKGKPPCKDPDSIDMQAQMSLEKPLPATKGALKKLVIDKPKAKSSAPVGNSPGPLGRIKLVLAKSQSYILMFNEDTGKWPLVVTCSWDNHQSLMEDLFQFALLQKVTKKQLVAKKVSMKGKAVVKKPAGASSSSSVERDIDEAQLLALATELVEESGAEDGSGVSGAEDAWWTALDELAGSGM